MLEHPGVSLSSHWTYLRESQEESGGLPPLPWDCYEGKEAKPMRIYPNALVSAPQVLVCHTCMTVWLGNCQNAMWRECHRTARLQCNMLIGTMQQLEMAASLDDHDLA